MGDKYTVCGCKVFFKSENTVCRIQCLLLFQVSSQASSSSTSGPASSWKTSTSGPKVRKSVSSRIHEAVKAIALCHNVTPVYESHGSVNGETESAEADQDFSDDNRTYQASSPDEVNMT